MNPADHILAAVALPLVGAIGIALAGKRPNLREAVTLVVAALLCLNVWSLLPAVLDGARPAVTVIDIIPGAPLAFEVEPLGMLFAAVASLLWIINSVYSIGYMRGNRERHQTRFYVCFAIALASTNGGRLRRQPDHAVHLLRGVDVARLAERNPHLRLADVERVVSTVLEQVPAVLARDDRLEIRGFGSFSVRRRPARTGRVPSTGAPVQ